jgi:hypothetical protein
VKAWRLTAPGGELSFRDVPEPAVTDGSALVRMHASPLLSYLEPIPVATLPLAELPAAMRRAEEPGAPLVVMT